MGGRGCDAARWRSLAYVTLPDRSSEADRDLLAARVHGFLTTSSHASLPTSFLTWCFATTSAIVRAVGGASVGMEGIIEGPRRCGYSREAGWLASLQMLPMPRRMPAPP